MVHIEEKYKVLTTYGFQKKTNVNFYEMSIGDEGKFAYPIPVKGKIPKSLIACYECDGIERRVLGTSCFTFEGSKIADIYHHPRHVIANRKVISLLNTHDIIGYRVCEVEFQNVKGIDNEHLENLRELEIMGKCYKMHSGGGEEIRHCKACKKVPDAERKKADYGIKIFEEFWDGSDIFMFDYGLLSVIVTEKIKKIFEEHEINNVRFIPLSELKLR